MKRPQHRNRVRVFAILEFALAFSVGIEATEASGADDNSASPQKAKAIAAELARFQGTWQLISAETNGKKMPDEQAKQIRVVIEGDRHTVTFGDKVVAHQVKFVIDPTTQPKTTEDTLDEGPNKGKKIRGIYVLDGDTLTSCVGAIDRPRPTEFSSNPESGQTLRRFKRIGPIAAVNAEVEAANAKEYKAFDGTWRIVSILAEGKQVPADNLKNSRLIFRGREFTAINERATTRGTILVDTSRSPKSIDITIGDGPNEGVIFRGIYELKDDMYKLCSSPTGKADRPKEFDGGAGSGYMVQVLERVKP